jgi:hypothetical protein
MTARDDDPRDRSVSGAGRPPGDAGRSTQSARARGLAGARLVRTDDGEWRVYELESGPYDRRSGFSLVFESDGVLRRVRDYPTGWRALSDAELMEVSWHR